MPGETLTNFASNRTKVKKRSNDLSMGLPEFCRSQKTAVFFDRRYWHGVIVNPALRC
jgi:hypothetical protein